MRAASALSLFVVLAGCAGPQAVEADGVGETVARFRDARALAVAAGRLYVVDAAEGVVHVLTPDGTRLDTYSGPGDDSVFLDPADLDPTNGLELFVADRGNARLARFSFDGRPIATYPVPAGEPAVLGPLPDDAEAVRGRPEAVAVGPADAVYAVEGERGVVLAWEGRRLVRVVGAEGPGRLAAPVGVATSSGGALFVADAGTDAVHVFSPLGRFASAIPAPGVRAVAVVPATAEASERLLITQADAARLVGFDGGEVVSVSLPGLVLVGAVIVQGLLYVLTPNRLVRIGAFGAGERP